MLSFVQTAMLLLTAAAATAVVLTRNPRDQTIPMSLLGVVLGLLFFLLEAPDVALSQIVVGGIIVPMMTLLTLAKAREYEYEEEEEEEEEEEKQKENEREKDEPRASPSSRDRHSAGRERE